MAIAVAAIAGYLFLPGAPVQPQSIQSVVSQAAVAGVMVNGDKITPEEIEIAYNRLPEELKQQSTRQDVAEDLINQRLLLQESAKKGISATDEEAEQYIAQLTQSGIDMAYIEEQVAAAGYTMVEYKSELKEMITLTKFLEEEIGLSAIRASESDVESFIQANKEELQVVLDEGDPGLQDVLKERIRNQLSLERQKQAIDAYLAGLKATAKIEY
ncbi:MAG: SurA N-terminal domain-containing protein [Candidatus Aenigmarchaeota archaeon]|nr:SurA N-terminal domain-containing protein [Candidatus Aenigmarchaeota archaeon]